MKRFLLILILLNDAYAQTSITLEVTSPSQIQRVIDMEKGGILHLQITNTSPEGLPAVQVQAELPEHWRDVYQDASQCGYLIAGASCTLILSAFSPNEPGELLIRAKNASQSLKTYVAFRAGGGLVFFKREGKTQVLKEAIYSRRKWYNGYFNVLGANDVYNGRYNTQQIISAQGEGSYAAQGCQALRTGEYSDWYLPAICQLSNHDREYGEAGCDRSKPTIHDQLFTHGFINIERGLYWSSSEYTGNFIAGMAFVVNFPHAEHAMSSKNAEFKYLCVRDLL